MIIEVKVNNFYIFNIKNLLKEFDPLWIMICISIVLFGQILKNCTKLKKKTPQS